MKSFKYIVHLFFLAGCVNVAVPDETWDSDDTKIWINEASGFNLDPFWFKEKSSNFDSTVLEFKQEFEENILNQIIRSKNFNQYGFYDSIKISQGKGDTLKGVWIKANKGFQFLQFKGNQYPMNIYVDTIRNLIVTITTK